MVAVQAEDVCEVAHIKIQYRKKLENGRTQWVSTRFCVLPALH
jgi:hypothetical protein